MFSFSQISLIGDHLSKNGDNDNNTNSCNRDNSDNNNDKFSFFCSSLFQVFFFNLESFLAIHFPLMFIII